MIYMLKLKSNEIVFVDSDLDWFDFLKAKTERKDLMLMEVMLKNGKYEEVGEILVDIYSIETIRKIEKKNKK